MADLIPLRGVRVHNLRGIDVDVPLGKLTVITGVSGAGKSSLAFDTLYAEAQRRYLQSFSPYTRQFLERFDQPEADFIGDLPPAIAVNPHSLSGNPRATVGTVTEIFDYLRLLFVRSGTVQCLKCGREVKAQKTVDVLQTLASQPAGTRFSIGFPSKPESDQEIAAWLEGLREEGFVRVQIGSTVHRLEQSSGEWGAGSGEKEENSLGSPLPTLRSPLLPPHSPSCWVLVDRLEVGKTPNERITDSLETAFTRGQGRLALLGDGQEFFFDQRLLCPYCEILYPNPEPGLLHFNDPRGACPECQGTGGLAKSQETCPICRGSRLSETTRYLRLAGKTIDELCGVTLADLANFLHSLRQAGARSQEPGVRSQEPGARSKEIENTVRKGTFATPPGQSLLASDSWLLTPDSRLLAPDALLLDALGTRLEYLQRVELGYLTLQRGASSLSTGEARRVRLTTALGSNLVNALYVFDEPTAGLHPRATGKILAELLRLRSAGNTLVVVEHDAEVLAAADCLIDLGPGAGEEGGQVLYQGPPGKGEWGEGEERESLTGLYFSGRRKIPVPTRRRPCNHGTLHLEGARVNNLQNLTVDFPLGVLCVVTGVSGAGKNSLVQQALYPALIRRQKPGARSQESGTGNQGKGIRKQSSAGGNQASFLVSESRLLAPAEVYGAGQINEVVLMDQEPLGRTGRSNPATFLKVFDEIRKVFADTIDARIHNFGPGHFSFNQPGGRCETCEGQGTLTVDMQFLADVTMTCPECLGSRFKKEILDIKVRSLNIAEVLNLTVREAFRFFRAQPAIERKLKFLLDVGLDYVRLGQPADTLSGGESQRLKLAGHLAASRKPRCLFLLLEPTTGLHPADVEGLLACFDRLLATGHSLIVVEHNLDVIRSADHIIDLGPGAGPAGGGVVATGTPEEIARVAASATGQCLRVIEGSIRAELDPNR